jgi:hypothetical protein
MALAAMGETAMSPVITELGTVEMPVFARMTKLPAVPRSTGSAPIETLIMVTVERIKRFNFMSDLD